MFRSKNSATAENLEAVDVESVDVGSVDVDSIDVESADNQDTGDTRTPTEVEEKAAETGKQKKPAGPFTWLIRIVTSIAAIFVLSVLTLSVIIPAITGWVPLTVASGSMEPTYPVGSMVIGQPLSEDEAKSLTTNDVITFMPYPDDPTLVTHRIVSTSMNTEGTVSYTTRGDANNANDPEPVKDFQVRALVKYHVPYVGYVATWLDGDQKQTILYGVIGALGLYVLYQLGAGVRERRSRA